MLSKIFISVEMDAICLQKKHRISGIYMVKTVCDMESHFHQYLKVPLKVKV